jgi:tripartite ATP-independent transporter DctP family solute receptor
MTKKLIALLLALAMVFTMAACGGGEEAGESEYASMTIKIGGTVPEEHPLTMGLYKFKEIVEAESGGAMKVEVFPNGQLGTGRELVEAIQLGNVDMAECTLSAYSSFTDEFTMLSLPFLFKNRESAYAFMDSEMAAQMSANVADMTGVRVMAYWENGIRMLTNGKRTVTSPEDMVGLKIRVMESPIYLKSFTAMGANPMPMAFGELYTALQQNTIDGQDNPYTITVTNKFYEIQPFMTDLGHVFDITGFQANEEWYASLGEKEKELIDKATLEATAYQREQAIAAEGINKQTIIDGGVELTILTDEQRAVFRESCSSVYDWFRAEGKPITDLDAFLEAVEATKQ